MSENNAVKLPEVIVFAGPNGSGKTTITGMAKTVGEYINADDIKRTTLCTDIEAAQKAEELREKMISEKRDFTFETVLSIDRNLLLLKKAKEQLIVDEMLAICSDIDRWKDKKAGEEANARYNELLYYGLNPDE